MRKIESIIVKWAGKDVGRLGLTKEGLSVFEYSKDFLMTGISISPFELPLKEGIFIGRPDPFNGGFGVFDDSLPDGWGLLVQDRYLQKNGINPNTLTLLDRLTLVGTQGRGALEFYPDYSLENVGEFIDFQRLAAEAREILENHSYLGEGIEEFQRKGGSPGGARPKVSVIYEGEEWLVKFKAQQDPDNIGNIEYDYSLLAKKCGIEMADTRLFEGKYFGTKRFDRDKGKKYHIISMAGLLRANYRLPSIDYLHIFKTASILCKNNEELWKIFRLMTFNYLIGNKDDHAKNFSFIYRDGDWHFSPAYDLLPGGGINGYHTTSINDSITPQRKDLIEVARKVGFLVTEAEREYDRIADIIKKEYDYPE